MANAGQLRPILVGGFVLDLDREALSGSDGEIRLRPKTFEVLRYLLMHRGRVITKQELIEAVWRDASVTDDSLVQCLIEIRRALGDEDHRLIKTIIIDVASGRTEWAETFDESFTDLFALQDAIFTRVAGQLASAFTAEERRALVRCHTRNLEAYDSYLRGRFFWEKRTEAHLRTAIGYFEQAVQRGDRFALAYAGLAHSYCVLASTGTVPREQVLESLRSAASKALELDDQAMRRRAYELDPLNLQINVDLADVLYTPSLEIASARVLLRQLEQETARRYVTPLDFAVIYAGLGENDHALEWLERAFRDRLLRVKRLDAV